MRNLSQLPSQERQRASHAPQIPLPERSVKHARQEAYPQHPPKFLTLTHPSLPAIQQSMKQTETQPNHKEPPHNTLDPI